MEVENENVDVVKANEENPVVEETTNTETVKETSVEGNVTKINFSNEEPIKKEEPITEEKPVEEKDNLQTDVVENKAKPLEETEVELSEERVLNFIKNKYGKELTTLEEVLAENAREALPEDVESFLKYKKKTGRGIEDYIKLQQDFTKMDEEVLLAQYLLQTNEGLDEEDVSVMLQDFRSDEDLDSETEIKSKNLKRKQELIKARKHFEEQKQEYMKPLESNGGIPDEELVEFKSFKEHLANSQVEQEKIQKQGEYFLKKTDELFTTEFKGFKYNVGEREVVMNFGESTKLKELQKTPLNFISKFMDAETGLIKDPEGYHKGLATAMNPDKVAKFFYDLGKAEMAESIEKSDKNINMETRRSPEGANKEGVKVTAIDNNPGGQFGFKK